jgi:hypothetical protein
MYRQATVLSAQKSSILIKSLKINTAKTLHYKNGFVPHIEYGVLSVGKIMQ